MLPQEYITIETLLALNYF